MLKYTKSTLLHTLDYIKKAISIFDILFQLFYITYISYRLFSQSGNIIANIVLLSVTVFYFAYHLITMREFYTKKEIKLRKNTRVTVKIIKYTVRLYVITIAVIELYKGLSANANMTILITVMMILGLVLSVIFDIILKIVNKHVDLIKVSFYHDAKLFREKYKKTTWLAKQADIDIENLLPTISDPEIIKEITDINHKQETKAMRKRDFKKQNNS